jgi:outer membrane protein insertion porin family
LELEIFHEPISTFIGRPDPTNPASTPSDIDIYIKATERKRILLKTGTDVGNVEGSAYGNAKIRNIFGGAESLDIYASAGTRTKSSYQAIFGTPILADPDKRLTVDAYASTTSKEWASHDEILKGGNLKYGWATKSGTTHQVGYTGVWRQITGLAANASPTVRNDAGDSVKSSVTHQWIMDQRDYPLLPSRGYLLKTVSEIAGWGPLRGDVAFWKSEVETAGAIPVPIPGVPGLSGVSLTGSFRAGVLYPLPVGFGRMAEPSKLNDRFQLGGPTDVRGFKISGLGPHDGQDAVGGDIYAAASTNLLLPFPRVAKDTPLRFQIFANAGRLVSLKDSKGKGKAEDSKSTQKDFYGSLAQLGDGIPSLSAGVGIVYAHPVARFEMNFSLPLVIRKGEIGRKGLQFGVGINFM